MKEKDYAKICRPLHDLLRKDSFQWSATHTEVFNLLKTKLTTCPILALPDFSKSFVLETDACGTGLGAVLMQSGKTLGNLGGIEEMETLSIRQQADYNNRPAEFEVHDNSEDN